MSTMGKLQLQLVEIMLHCFLYQNMHNHLLVTVIDLVFILLDCKSGRRDRYGFYYHFFLPHTHIMYTVDW